jgi:AraC family transcriptional regulator
MLGSLRLIELIWKVLEPRLELGDRPASAAMLADPSGAPSRVLEQAVLYIQNHFYRNPTIADIAEACFVSERHLSRLFLKDMRMTVNQYVQNERLFYAVAELKHTDTPLAHISERLQFSSLQYFSQWFKGMSSMTPAAFRKKHRPG